ncbi:Leucine-rich repeat-containing protein 4C [Portunus trituberculatus]|uniref:Leucine-rich repeat-containing protein 4C n=2 Tax=Portunus trituberculatus TaxID=210409 RepID=A0A5B7H4F6_PORTR|nr:Leucine-rich repeat-containing protein 4C [Portunus trituberculatus]
MMSTLRSCSGLRQSGKRRKIQALVWVLLWLCVLRGTAGECPKVCECKWRDGKETVTCIGTDFTNIPRQLDPSTQVLDLQHSNLQVLPRDAFADSDLVNLQKLWLNHCKITHLERGAFNMLDNLVDLDMSKNLLRVVPTAALIDIPGLRELSLAHNDLSTIPADAFAPIPDLVTLDLSNNRIRSINPKAFRCLATLEVLKLSGNLLVYLMQDLLVPLKALHGLNLNNNPWTCDCRLRPMRQWMLDHKITSVTAPTCGKPKRVSGTSWKFLELDEFVCEPHVSAVTEYLEADEDDSVSLVCRVDADVEVSVSWLFREKPLGTQRKSSRYRLEKQMIANQSAVISNLTIMRAEPRDQGTYTCVAENKAGRSEAHLTLQVEREETEGSLVYVDKKYMTGSLLSGLGVLVTILLLVSCIVHRRQRVRRFRRQEEDREMRGVNATCAMQHQTQAATANATTIPAPVTQRPSATQQRKPSDYLIIPSGESDAPPLHPLQRDHAWLQPEAVNGGYTRSGYLENGRYDNSSLERYREDVLEDMRGHQRSPSTISYVELPSTELPRRHSTLTDKESLMNLEFETDILRRECSPTGSVVSVVSNGQLEDLLGLPYPAPRREARQSLHPQDINNIARKHRPYVYDDRRQRDRMPYDPSSLNAR